MRFSVTARPVFGADANLVNDTRALLRTGYTAENNGSTAGDSSAPSVVPVQEHVFPNSGVSAANIAHGCVGSEATDNCRGIQYWEIRALSTGGLSNFEVVAFCNDYGAQAPGLDRDLGSIESGKLADVMVLDRNPLDDIRNTTSTGYLMKNSEVFEGDALNQIWPVKEPLPYMVVERQSEAGGHC